MNIRGFLGEESFEIRDGDKIIERLCEAHVFSATMRTAMKFNRSTPDARVVAQEAVRAFRATRREEEK